MGWKVFVEREPSASEDEDRTVWMVRLEVPLRNTGQRTLGRGGRMRSYVSRTSGTGPELFAAENDREDQNINHQVL